MFSIDPRSLTATAGLMGAVIGLLILGLQRRYPSNIHGMRLWGWAPLVCTVSTVIYALDGLLPTVLSTMGGNSLLFLGIVLGYGGSRLFYGEPMAWGRWLAWLVVVQLAIAYFLLVQPDYRWRVVLFTSGLSLPVLAHAWLLHRNSHGFTARFVRGVLLVQVLVLWLRAIAATGEAPDATRFTPSLLQSIYIATYTFTVLLTSTGVLLLASERVRDELHHLATHDALTGILSRRSLLERCQQALAQWQRSHLPLCLLVLDIDHFKAINDQHGHLAGDQVLKALAQQLQQGLRGGDLLGRFGGEEFVVLMPHTPLDQALRVAERLRQAVADMAATPERPACTASLGLTEVRSGDSFESLFARADQALYQAKHQGRNRTVTV